MEQFSYFCAIITHYVFIQESRTIYSATKYTSIPITQEAIQWGYQAYKIYTTTKIDLKIKLNKIFELKF